MNRIKRTSNFALGIIALAATALPLAAGPTPDAADTEPPREAAPAEAEAATDASVDMELSFVEEVTQHPDGMLSLVVGPHHDAALQSGESQDGTPALELRCSEKAASPGGAGSPSAPTARAEKE